MTAPTPDLTPEQPKALTEEEKTAIAVQEALAAEEHEQETLLERMLETETELHALSQKIGEKK